jgi:amino acid transporter
MAAFLRVGTPAGFDAHEGDALAYVGGGLGGVWRGALTVTVLVSLAAAMQATLIYLSRSLFAMGRDGVLPAALGRLDRREQPALAVALLTGIGITCTLASGLSPSIHAAFAFILDGTSVFLGVLFVISAAAAACVFWRDPDRRISGVLLPAAGALALVVIIVFSIVRAEAGTRAFELVAALAGLPLALWRGRAWHEVAPG